MTLASGGGESYLPACGPTASFSVHLASSAITPGIVVVCMTRSVVKSVKDSIVEIAKRTN